MTPSMQFSRDLQKEFRRRSKAAAFGEIAQFRALRSAFGALKPRFQVEEYHGAGQPDAAAGQAVAPGSRRSMLCKYGLAPSSHAIPGELRAVGSAFRTAPTRSPQSIRSAPGSATKRDSAIHRCVRGVPSNLAWGGHVLCICRYLAACRGANNGVRATVDNNAAWNPTVSWLCRQANLLLSWNVRPVLVRASSGDARGLGKCRGRARKKRSNGVICGAGTE